MIIIWNYLIIIWDYWSYLITNNYQIKYILFDDYFIDYFIANNPNNPNNKSKMWIPRPFLTNNFHITTVIIWWLFVIIWWLFEIDYLIIIVIICIIWIIWFKEILHQYKSKRLTLFLVHQAMLPQNACGVGQNTCGVCSYEKVDQVGAM